jgi:RND family efflux transporter MFP subunit
MNLKLKFKQHKYLWIAAAAVALVAAVFILLGGKKPIPVKIITVKAGELRVIVNATTTSTIRSETEVTLSAQRTGRLVRMPVREGDLVSAGALIVRLDLTEEEVQSRNALAQSRATFEEAEKNMERMKDLFGKGMVSQQDLDGVRRSYEVAKSQQAAAQDDMRVKSDYSEIRAPFGGVVSKKFTEAGELVTPGKQIVTLVDTERIYVLATIDEIDVGRLRLGQPTTITVDAFPGEKFPGKVGRISPIVSGGKLETRTADVRIYLDEKQQRIKPGMSADVEILVAVLHDVLSVPSQAVLERDGGKKVYVSEGRGLKAGAKTTVALRNVEIGETNWNQTQVTGGLQSGEFVVTTPEATGLKDGAKVIIE